MWYYMIIKRYIKKDVTKNRIKMGGITMAVLTTNKPNMFIIKENRMKDFIKESNNNKITSDFLSECRKASNIFKRK